MKIPRQGCLDGRVAGRPKKRSYPNAFISLCLMLLWSVPATRALDNIGGADYGAIGPVMDYDPATGTKSPFFPIGWYFFWPTDGPYLDEVAASGANTVLFSDCKDNPSWLWSNAIMGMN